MTFLLGHGILAVLFQTLFHFFLGKTGRRRGVRGKKLFVFSGRSLKQSCREPSRHSGPSRLCQALG